MERKLTNTRFFTINHRKDDKSIKKIIPPIKQAEEKYYKLFKTTPKHFTIHIVYSRKEFDKHAGFKTEKWANGYVRPPFMYMYSPSVRDKYVEPESSYSYETFFDHEINHFFYVSLTGTYHPVWLSEGYACYMMEKNPRPVLPEEKLKELDNPEEYLFHRYIRKKYYKYAYEFYAVSFLTVKYLIEQFGHDKILTLIKSFARKPYKKHLEKEFKRLYGMSTKEAAREAIKSFIS